MIRLPCSATLTGRNRPGMTSASPAVSSAERSTPEFAGRQTPWSNEAEQAVLGAMLLDQDAALKSAELLDDTMFYREGHRLLFRSMIALTERGDVIDPVTLRRAAAAGRLGSRRGHGVPRESHRRGPDGRERRVSRQDRA